MNPAIQGYYISGVFALGGVLLGALLSFFFDIFGFKIRMYIREREDARVERKKIYISVIKFLNKCYPKPNELQSDSESLISLPWGTYIEEIFSFLDINNANLQIYASKVIRNKVGTCISFLLHRFGDFQDSAITDESIIRQSLTEVSKIENDILLSIKKELKIKD